MCKFLFCCSFRNERAISRRSRCKAVEIGEEEESSDTEIEINKNNESRASGKQKRGEVTETKAEMSFHDIFVFAINVRSGREAEQEEAKVQGNSAIHE